MTASTLQMIPMRELKIAKTNMRHTRKAPDVADILPSVQRVGILQSPLVRPNCEGFEILAGRRRYFAAEQAGLTELPCLVGDFPDDAAAIEASARQRHSASLMTRCHLRFRDVDAGDGCRWSCHAADLASRRSRAGRADRAADTR